MLLLNIAPTVSWITSLRSIFAEPSKDTPCIVLAVSNAVAVSELPVTSPVTLPVTFPVTLPVILPSIFATNVPVVTVKLPVLAPVAVVVPTVNLSALSSHMMIALSPVLPLSITIPESLALEEAPLLSSMRLSLTTMLVVATVVVVPLTVRSPVTVRSFPIVTSLGKPIVTVALSEPDPLTSISLLVPAIVAT